MTIDHGRRERVRRSANQWARDLIELNHHNSLVSFRHTKTTSMELSGCSAEVVGKLLAGNKTTLRALFTVEEAHRDSCVRARSIHRKIVAFREEQGIEVGRIASGLVSISGRVSVGARAPLQLNAPLLLRPVAIHPRTAAENDFTVEVGPDIEINPVLLHALEREYGVGLAPGQLDELIGKINDTAGELISIDDQLDQAFSLLAEQSRRQQIELQLE